MTRVAAIDCGTNAIRLLVADVTRTDAGLSLVDVHRELRVVRLGEGVDRTGRLQPAAIDRTWAALADYTAILRASGATQVRMAATSATRDADNSAEFSAMVVRTLGQPPEIITGEAEAELSFRGAVGDLEPDDGPFLVVDIGGGSTELVVGTLAVPAAERHRTQRDQSRVRILRGVSTDIGCVRITERILHGDPPRTAEIRDARALAGEVLRRGCDTLPLEDVRTVVAVAGTATTIAAAALHLPSYDPARLHLARLSVDELVRAGEFLLTATTAHRGVLPYMHPGRVDVIGGGAVIMRAVLDLVAERTPVTDVVISEHDILDGLALSLGVTPGPGTGPAAGTAS